MPLFLEVKNNTVIAVGGGAVAARKIRNFLD
ncbi:NAD(P)-dependent oxidoreductase, partial [Shigella flexneri]